MEDVINPVTVVSLSCMAAMVVFSIICGFRLNKNLADVEKWVISWLVYDGLTHLTMESAFVYFSLTGTVEKADNVFALLWKEYGKADRRWLVSDPTIVSLEILTVVIDGLLCLVLIYAIVKNTKYRHFVQIILCVCELFGGWMTFCPEWLTGSENLMTDNILYLWVYMVFFNGLWVVIPAALLFQSFVAMTTDESGISGQNASPVKGKRKSANKQPFNRVQVMPTDINTESKTKYNTRSRKDK